MSFVLINEKEESSKVSSIVSDNKPGYVEKLSFKPLPPKEGKKRKKKKKKRSKRREVTVSPPKHVAPIIVFADESELDDFPMPVIYESDLVATLTQPSNKLHIPTPFRRRYQL